MGRDNIFLLALLFTPAIAHAVCPDGYTTYLGTVQDGVARNSSGVCAPLCEYGASRLATNGGHFFNLFSNKTTIPSINVDLNGGICYADLVAGGATGTLNVAFGDEIYHANTGALPCPKTYILSYDCGDGAIGTPPKSREIAWGELYSCPDDSAGCVKPGYHFAGWKIDNNALVSGSAYSYKYGTEKTMVAQWAPNIYQIAYLCNYCTSTNTSVATTALYEYQEQFNVQAELPCSNSFNMNLDSYVVLDVYGNETGDILLPGEVAMGKWHDNIALRAMWSGGDVVGTVPDVPAEYTLSYDCGEGATGTPPKSHSVRYGLRFELPYNAGTCVRPGYVVAGWLIDGGRRYQGANKYSYAADKTAVVRWSANTYRANYICNNGIGTSDNFNATYGGSYTPSNTVCAAPDGATFVGYAVHDAFGRDTGDVIANGASFVWNYPYNIQLHAIWMTN